MTKNEALAKIEYSLIHEEARILTPPGEVYDEHVAKISATLIASLIEPVRVTVTSTCAKEGDFNLYKNSIVWGIAKNNGNWLLTLEATRDFALGFGSEQDNIMMHGFSSSDALGEWCA